jgi:lipoprotein-releasing system permease protein
MFEHFIARRYLRAKRKQVVISVITWISVAGVAAGVMALVIALAINTGFGHTLERSLLGATAPVSILTKETGSGIEGWEAIAQKVSHLPHVTSAAPGLYDPGYLNGPASGSGVEIKGVVVDGKAPLPDTLLHLKSGSIDGLHSEGGELPGIILGARLADTIGASVGKQVTLIVPNKEITPFGMQPGNVRLRVAGVFESGYSDFDLSWAFMSLNEMQRAFALDDVVNSIELQVDDIYNASVVAAAAERVIGPRLGATTWEEQSRQLRNALKMERIVTAVTIFLIQIVAALNILIALVMMVMEKHRDIAILMSMGARARQIRKIFVFEGAMIGGVGTIIGLTLGYTLSYLANRYRWLPLDAQVYPLSFVPFEPRWTDGVWIAAAAMIVSLVATLYPAYSATRIDPVESLRYE